MAMNNTDIFNADENKVFIGNKNKLSEWLENNNDHSKAIERIRLLLKNYLELDNVSFLFGSGSSIHLGAVSIRNFPAEVEEYIKGKDIELGIEFESIIRKLQYLDWSQSLVRNKDSNDIEIEYETVLNYLIAKDFTLEQESTNRSDKIKELIVAIKEGLFKVCNVDSRDIPEWLLKELEEKGEKEIIENIKTNKYHFHEKFVKSLLQRPLNLKRANIFTLNYDLAFEYAFDKLGVFYIDGFAGFHKRYFKPETFEYDMFYPGSTTAGKVQRIEKVVRYFKLHGSLSWVSTENRDANNLYGIEELPIPLIEKNETKGDTIIYPSAVKKSYTLDFPYSEMFRQFASTISQSQSVLIAVGYAFADEHINDIIFQALSNPSFTLIILAYSTNPEIERIKALNDSRIIILEGAYLADFIVFADRIMPDFYDMKTREKVASTMNEYFDRPNPNTNTDSHE